MGCAGSTAKVQEAPQPPAPTSPEAAGAKPSVHQEHNKPQQVQGTQPVDEDAKAAKEEEPAPSAPPQPASAQSQGAGALVPAERPAKLVIVLGAFLCCAPGMVAALTSGWLRGRRAGDPSSGYQGVCEQLAEKHDFVHLSIGKLLRKEIMSESDQGAEIAKMMHEGKILPSTMTIPLAAKAIRESATNASETSTTVLLDGFIRNAENLKTLSAHIGMMPTAALLFSGTQDAALAAMRAEGLDDNALTKRQGQFAKRVESMREILASQGVAAHVIEADAADPVASVVQKLDSAQGVEPQPSDLPPPTGAPATAAPAPVATEADPSNAAEPTNIVVLGGTDGAQRRVAEHLCTTMGLKLVTPVTAVKRAAEESTPAASDIRKSLDSGRILRSSSIVKAVEAVRPTNPSPRRCACDSRGTHAHPLVGYERWHTFRLPRSRLPDGRPRAHA